MAFALDQLFQVTLGLVPGLGFQAHQCQGIAQFVIVRVLLDQAGELHFGVLHAVLLHQHARVGQAQALVFRILLDAFFQQWNRFLAAIEVLQQARTQQDRRDFAFFRRILLQQLQRGVGFVILLQQQGLAENQLAVLRVFLQQAVEALHQTVARVLVSVGRRQREKVEMRVALALQDLLHIDHGVVITPGACQLNGRRALCFQVVRCVFGPDQRGVQRGLVGAQVLGDAERALGNSRILGVDGLGHVVIQGNVETIALAGEFRGQQAVHRFFSERGINLGLFRGGGAVFHRRRTVRRHGCHGLAAAEEDKSKEQRGRSIHIGRGRLTCGRIIMTQAFGQT